MFRYIAVIWSCTDAAQMRTAKDIGSRLLDARWQEPMQAAGLRVFQMGARSGFLDTQVLPCDAGVVIGTAFERRSDPLDDTMARKWFATTFETGLMLENRGRWLIEHCWGNYVAILRSAESRRIWVIKDPTGNLPAFVATVSGVTLIFSSVADLVGLGLARFTINVSCLRTRVLAGFDPGRQPLNGVEQIQRGECVEFDADAARMRSRQFYWLPQTFAESDATFEDPDLAARAMRATVRMCTHTWAARDSRVVLRLSGGLDSSIVAGCLADAPRRPKISCYTYFNPRSASDERPWARSIVARLNCEHTEVPVEPEDIDLKLTLQLPLLVEPTPIMGYTLRSTIEQTVATQSGALTVFNGDGGDSLFGAEALRFAASEYLLRRGPRAEVLRIASHVALRTHQSTWAVLYRAFHAWLTGATADPLRAMVQQVSRLVRHDVEAGDAAPDSCMHPWFANEEQVPWPTFFRLGMLLASPDSYNVIPRDDVPEVIASLNSQPVVETLLRIPLYRLFEGGRDRGLARRAFAGDVPEQILARQWKDRAPGFHDLLVFHNRAFLREVFLDGVLVREGLLDRVAIEDALSDSPSKSQVMPGEFMRHLDVEMWARAWEASLQRDSSVRSCAVPTY